MNRADPTDADLANYATPGPMTELREVKTLVDHLPTDPLRIAHVVQSLVLHN